jgi:CRP/FNR family transcriptional regulator, nitrogen fixation regulation protein
MASYFHIPSTDTSQAKGALGAVGPPASLEVLATVRRYERGQAIYGQDDSAEFWYRVVSGLLRRFSIRPSGRRQIVDFLQAGDFFGFAGGDELHGFCVEAVGIGTVVASYPRGRAEALADSDPRVGRFIRQMTLSAINRLQGQIRILGRTRAPEKVGSFLLDMTTRFAGVDGARLLLPMSRYDIADYLSLSVETVSRAMTDLQDRGAIMLAGTRQVTIVLHDVLDDDSGDEPLASRDTAARTLLLGGGPCTAARSSPSGRGV